MKSEQNAPETGCCCPLGLLIAVVVLTALVLFVMPDRFPSPFEGLQGEWDGHKLSVRGKTVATPRVTGDIRDLLVIVDASKGRFLSLNFSQVHLARDESVDEAIERALRGRGVELITTSANYLGPDGQVEFELTDLKGHKANGIRFFVATLSESNGLSIPAGEQWERPKLP